MGNCSTLDSNLQIILEDFRSCTQDLQKPSNFSDKLAPSPQNYPQKTLETSLKLNEYEEDSLMKLEEPYVKYIENFAVATEENKEQILDFKLLSVKRESLRSLASETCLQEKTGPGLEESLQENINPENLEKCSNIYEPSIEPMNKDQMYSSCYKLPNTNKNILNTCNNDLLRASVLSNVYNNTIKLDLSLRSPLKASKTSSFFSPFKKMPQSFQAFKEAEGSKARFFKQTLAKMGPFSYALSEEFLRENPSFHEFLQQAKNFPVSLAKTLENGAIYTGQWKNGQRNGQGKQVWLDGSYYEGYWFQDKAHGKGRLVHMQGTIYEGYWLFDQAHGPGAYYTEEGSFYQGNWYADKQHGLGLEKWASGASYEGSYFMGMKHGRGCFVWEDGSKYQGEFHENLIQGKGKYFWGDGREYNGEWVSNRMNGKGIFKWPDGRIYSGQFENDEKHGIGTFFWPDGSMFKGFWVRGKEHGQGKFIDQEGKVKNGIWENGQPVSL